MTAKEAINLIKTQHDIYDVIAGDWSFASKAIEALEKQMFPFETIEWHEIKCRDLTDDEKAYYEEHDDCVPNYIFDCPMPDDGDEILIATKYGVDKDVASIDFGCFLEGRGDWEDVIAWAHMPKYKEKENE